MIDNETIELSELYRGYSVDVYTRHNVITPSTEHDYPPIPENSIIEGTLFSVKHTFDTKVNYSIKD